MLVPSTLNQNTFLFLFFNIIADWCERSIRGQVMKLSDFLIDLIILTNGEVGNVKLMHCQ